jgi:hypothetical protein
LPACEEEGAKKREEREARKGRESKEERREPPIAKRGERERERESERERERGRDARVPLCYRGDEEAYSRASAFSRPRAAASSPFDFRSGPSLRAGRSISFWTVAW